MNKMGLVLGATAIIAIAGCKDPDYVYRTNKSQDEVRPVPEEVEKKEEPKVAPQPAQPEPKEEVKVENIEVKEEVNPAPAPQPVQPKEETTTTYIVQRGDYLAKISKKFNVTISSIKRVNPSIKDDNMVRIGQKIKLPGKHDVGEQKAPAGSFKKPAAAQKKSAPKANYTGETKEYVVKSGDNLGAIAYGHGITIAQLKKMNNLEGNIIRIGQKLKVPAKSVEKKATATPAQKKPVETKKAATVESAKPAEAKEAEAVKSEAASPAATESEAAAPAAAATAEPADATEPAAPAQENFINHVVEEGEDVTGVAVRFNISPARIREINNLSGNDELKPGMVLKIPAEVQ